MSDPGNDEPDVSGARNYGISGSVDLNKPFEDLSRSLGSVNTQLSAFDSTMKKVMQTTSGFVSAMGNVTKSISSVSSAAGSNSGSQGYNNGGASGGGGGGFASTLAGSLFGSSGSNWVQSLLMFPTRFINDQLTANRNIAMATGATLGPQSFGAGTDIQKMMTALSGQFGNVLGGSPTDLLSLMNIGGRVGAGLDWRFYTGTTAPGTMGPPGQYNAPRAAGYLEAVRQAQIINPGADVSQLAGTIGGQLANTTAAQQSAFLTGGAFSMIGSGNRAKSVSEWAEGVLKWLMNQRPGQFRGKPFTYGELMTQNFPGSNIDAWFQVNGVSQDMRDYWWSYALGKASNTNTTGGAPILGQQEALPSNVQSNVTYQRLAASNASTRTGFQLGGQLAGMYGNMEQSNRWFNSLLGQMMNQVLPAAVSSGGLSWMQFLPDAMREMLMQFAERSPIGSLGAGILGWGSLLGENVLGGLAGASLPAGLASILGMGDVGDVGDFGPLGGTSTAGLHPDARKRVDAMMKANPRLRVTSGFRDLGTQQRLKRKGVGRVSGRPSDHTRGMAADLGPRSEYGWIAANASRFGLKSGVGAGEPWHVGMGDVGDVGDFWSDLTSGIKGPIESLLTMFGQFGSVFKADATSSDQITGVASSTSTLLRMLMALFSGGTTNTEAISFRPNVFDQLVTATNATFKQGLPVVRPLGKSDNGVTTIESNKIPTGGESVGTLNAFFTDVLRGMGYPVSPNNLAKLGAVARIEGNKSGTYNPFNSVNGSQFPKFNSAGVRNYPDWATGVQYTIKQLQKTTAPGGAEMGMVRDNLASDGTYLDFRNDMVGFYNSWKGYDGARLLSGTSQSRAAEMLTHEINMGDIGGGEGGGSSSISVGGTNFFNTFVLSGGGGSGGNGGIDLRKTASQLADVLEAQMKQRMARTN